MSRYIDADELLELYNTNDLKEDVDWMVPIEVVKQNIKDMPFADVEPVKHGRWLDRTQEPGWPDAECSVCGSHAGMFWMNYCPYCGARMDGESE